MSQEEQLQLRKDFGRHLDGLPPTCSMDLKVDRFRRWLAERGVDFDVV